MSSNPALAGQPCGGNTSATVRPVTLSRDRRPGHLGSAIAAALKGVMSRRGLRSQ